MNMHNLKWILLGAFLIITGLGLPGIGTVGILSKFAGIVRADCRYFVHHQSLIRMFPGA